MIRTGCAGFPVSRERYFAAFGAVEVASLPQLETARRWREAAPKGFEFSLAASRRVTHPDPAARGATEGHFRARPEVEQAWAETRALAEALEARFVVFETPASFYADAGHLRDMYRFFKALPRGSTRWVWQPAPNWEEKLVGRVCADLGLIRAMDPALPQAGVGPVRYFRVPGGGRGKPLPGRQLGDEQLKGILARCAGQSAYVFFGNAGAWHDARRFQDMARGLVPSPARGRGLG